MNIEYKVVFLKKVNTQLIQVRTRNFKEAVASIKFAEKTYLIDWTSSSYMKTVTPFLFKKHTYFVYYIDLDTTKQYNFLEGCSGIDPAIVDIYASQMVVKQIAKGIGGATKTNWLSMIVCVALGALASALVCVILYTQKISELSVNVNPVFPI